MRQRKFILTTILGVLISIMLASTSVGKVVFEKADIEINLKEKTFRENLNDLGDLVLSLIQDLDSTETDLYTQLIEDDTLNGYLEDLGQMTAAQIIDNANQAVNFVENNEDIVTLRNSVQTNHQMKITEIKNKFGEILGDCKTKDKSKSLVTLSTDKISFGTPFVDKDEDGKNDFSDEDTDNDGVDDLQEFLDGTNFYDSADYLIDEHKESFEGFERNGEGQMYIPGLGWFEEDSEWVLFEQGLLEFQAQSGAGELFALFVAVTVFLVGIFPPVYVAGLIPNLILWTTVWFGLALTVWVNIFQAIFFTVACTILWPAVDAIFVFNILFNTVTASSSKTSKNTILGQFFEKICVKYQALFGILEKLRLKA